MGVGRDMNSFISWKIEQWRMNFFDVMRKTDLNEEDEEGFIDQLYNVDQALKTEERIYVISYAMIYVFCHPLKTS